MADYDVSALALTTPPASAAKTTYRPAISVRNNGIHDALARGTLQIFKAGRLVFSTELYSAVIPPKQTRPATATTYFKPSETGRYQVNAYITCDHDQYEPNNNLPTSFFDVTEEPPPPPPEVALHASQHEEGGTDEISIDGLRGLTAEPQTPREHADTHASGGADELDVTGLHGALADPQATANHANEKHTVPFATVSNLTDHIVANPAHQLASNLEKTANKGKAGGYAPLGDDSKVPLANLPPLQSGPHASTHEHGGDDEINVDGLSGVLASAQIPQTHDNTAHSRQYEDTAHKDAPDGYAGLDDTGLVPSAELAPPPVVPPPPNTAAFLSWNRQWELLPPTTPAHHASSHETGGVDEISINGLSGRAADAQYPLAHVRNHAAGGIDELSIAGLRGVAAEPQDPSAHAANHAHGGLDELSIAGLAGNPAARGAAGGLASLNDQTLIPSSELASNPPSNQLYLCGDRTWAAPIAAAHANTHVDDGSDVIEGPLRAWRKDTPVQDSWVYIGTSPNIGNHRCVVDFRRAFHHHFFAALTLDSHQGLTPTIYAQVNVAKGLNAFEVAADLNDPNPGPSTIIIEAHVIQYYVNPDSFKLAGWLSMTLIPATGAPSTVCNASVNSSVFDNNDEAHPTFWVKQATFQMCTANLVAGGHDHLGSTF